MAIRAILICAMAALLGLARPLVPAGHAADSPAGGRLALVSGEDYPPFADPRLPGGGLAVMLVRRVVEAMGVSATVDFMPWRRGYEETLRGRFDATFPYVRTADRERDFLYSDALIQMRQVVFMSAARRFGYRSPEDLHGRRACIALGYAPPAVLQAMLDGNLVERVTATGAGACPGLVAADRADFFVQDERIGAATVAKAGLSAAIVTVGNPSFGSTELHVIVPRDRPGAAALIRRFNDGLRRLRNSGDYEHLLLQ